MSRRKWLDRPAEPRTKMFHRAADISAAHVGHLVTVTTSEIHRSRGHLVAVRPWTADDLTGAPGDVVLLLRARRGHRQATPQWKVVVPPDAPVLVHTTVEPIETREEATP